MKTQDVSVEDIHQTLMDAAYAKWNEPAMEGTSYREFIASLELFDDLISSDVDMQISRILMQKSQISPDVDITHIPRFCFISQLLAAT